MSNINPQFILSRDTYKNASVRSLRDYKDVMQEIPKLSDYVTHLAFNAADFGKKNFPLMYLTKGAGKVKRLPSGQFDFRYGIMGKPKKTSTISRSVFSANDTPGLGGLPFTVPFKDGWFSPQATVIKSYAGKIYTMRVQAMEKKGNEYFYTFTYYNTDKTKYIPVAILDGDVSWAEGISKVPYENSKGTLSKTQFPGEATGSVGIYRHGMKSYGNSGNIAMVYSIPTESGTFKFAQDWEWYVNMLEWNEKMEAELWFSVYGRDLTGDLAFFDIETDTPITSGAGIDQQITNSDTYSTLTFNKWNNLIRHVMFNIRDVDSTPMLDIYTGTIGMERVNTMLTNQASGLSPLTDTGLASKAITGSGSNLQFGAYFNSFRHIDGYVINFIRHPMFDRGILGESANIDIQTGLPETSGDFYFIDRSSYGGQDNIQYVEAEDFAYNTFTVTGVGNYNAKMGGNTSNRAHERHSAELHGMGSGGIIIKNPSTCFKLKYVSI